MFHHATTILLNEIVKIVKVWFHAKPVKSITIWKS